MFVARAENKGNGLSFESWLTRDVSFDGIFLVGFCFIASLSRTMGMKLYAFSTAFLSLASSSRRVLLSSAVKSQNQTVFVSATGRVSASSLYTTINGASDGMPEQNPSALVDPVYPGTAVERLQNVHRRVAELAQTEVLNGPWEEVRRRLLWAGGLRDLPHALPGQVCITG
jgi:hypothetical protein